MVPLDSPVSLTHTVQRGVRTRSGAFSPQPTEPGYLRWDEPGMRAHTNHVHLHMFTSMCTHLHVHLWLSTHALTYKHAHKRIDSTSSKHLFSQKHTYTHTHTYMHKFVHACTHTYTPLMYSIYMHAQTQTAV